MKSVSILQIVQILHIHIYGYIFYGYIFLLDPSPIIVREKTGCCLVDLTGVTLADEESYNANTS